MRVPDLPLRRKLLLIAALAPGLALALHLLVQIALMVRASESAELSRLTAMAQVLALPGATALQRDDPRAAADALAALQTRPDVVRALLRRADGSVLAEYPGPATGNTPSEPPPTSPQVRGGLLEGMTVVEQPLSHAGVVQGSLRIDADRTAGRRLLFQDLALALAGAAAAFCIAMLVAMRLLRPVAVRLDQADQADRSAPAAFTPEPAHRDTPLPAAAASPAQSPPPAPPMLPALPSEADPDARQVGMRTPDKPAQHGALPRPVERPVAGPAATPSGTHRHTARLHARVLLAEDNQVNREIATAMLHAMDCKVTQAHDGTQALAAALRRGIDLVLMDCQMPVMDGFEATRRIRAWEQDQPGRPHVPIVALTANALAGDREACLAAGMDDYLVKPVSSSRLADTLARHLSGLGQPSPAPELPTLDAQLAAITTPLVYDPAVLASLPMVADGTHPHFMEDMQRLFADSNARTLADVDAAMAKADSQWLLRLLHSMKSASAQVGAMEVSALARDYEHALRAGRPPAPHWPAQLRQAFERLLAAWPDRVQAAERLR